MKVWRGIDKALIDGYAGSYTGSKCVMEWFSLEKGYNEYLFDTGTERFAALSKVDEDDFYLSYLFGCYGGHREPEDGEYHLRISMFVDEEMGYGLLDLPMALESEYAARAHLSELSKETLHSEKASHADVASKGIYAVTSGTLGVKPIVQKPLYFSGQFSNRVNMVGDMNMVDLEITSDLTLKGDKGFSFYIGTVEELRGKKIIFFRDEACPFSNICLNAGAQWANSSYADIKGFFTRYHGDFWIADFDVLLNRVITSCHLDENFSGEIYIMIFGNSNWTLPGEGEILHNRYNFFSCMDDSLAYTPAIHQLMTDVDELKEKTEYVPSDQTITTLQTRCSDLEAEVEALQAGNVLWGKKYFATGDSFTQGDFTGWVDENGLSGRNSPVIYDSDWKP